MDFEGMKKYLKGTTTVGLTCNEGVVLISDKRATMGSLVAHKIVQKTFCIDKHIGATVAGAVGDAQALIRWMQAEARLYRMRKGEEMSVKAIATLMANVMFSQRMFPFIVQAIVGGYDKSGARLFSLDPLGSVIEDKYIATGSGSPVAYGVLEAYYKEELPLKECIKIGVKALKSALARDAMTGDGIDIVEITQEGYKQYTKEEIEDILKEL